MSADLLTYQQEKDIGVHEWTCYKTREEYMESADCYESKLAETYRAIPLEVFFSCQCDVCEDPVCGDAFFFQYAERIFASMNVYTTDEHALKAGKEAIDKLLQILF